MTLGRGRNERARLLLFAESDWVMDRNRRRRLAERGTSISGTQVFPFRADVIRADG